MSKLRAHQKAQRRELIEIAAKNLFVEKGFELASIEEIAALAMVSQATVYNYYGSKDELLLAIVARGEVGVAQKDSDFSDRAISENPVDLVTEVIMSNVHDTISTLSRELWGNVIAYVATTADKTVAPRYIETIAGGLGTAIFHVLESYQKQEKISSNIDVEYLSNFLTRNERIQFLNFIYLKDMSITDLGNSIRKDVTFILTPLIK
ncbi:TetR/AcrR family transcriptional regulator [Gammaproteobacteria bacterium]|jgi:AcrR family transcriptional regulator|nr:TetR/AcrR family transcriptional regulator [Gammaproteobacteria bacterium]|tara:strand:- start:14773 stop:15393 length:621 start_codon:yes stop_codon:yes gene_type:complete